MKKTKSHDLYIKRGVDSTKMRRKRITTHDELRKYKRNLEVQRKRTLDGFTTLTKDREKRSGINVLRRSMPPDDENAPFHGLGHDKNGSSGSSDMPENPPDTDAQHSQDFPGDEFDYIYPERKREKRRHVFYTAIIDHTDMFATMVAGTMAHEDKAPVLEALLDELEEFSQNDEDLGHIVTFLLKHDDGLVMNALIALYMNDKADANLMVLWLSVVNYLCKINGAVTLAMMEAGVGELLLEYVGVLGQAEDNSATENRALSLAFYALSNLILECEIVRNFFVSEGLMRIIEAQFREKFDPAVIESTLAIMSSLLAPLLPEFVHDAKGSAIIKETTTLPFDEVRGFLEPLGYIVHHPDDFTPPVFCFAVLCLEKMSEMIRGDPTEQKEIMDSNILLSLVPLLESENETLQMAVMNMMGNMLLCKDNSFIQYVAEINPFNSIRTDMLTSKNVEVAGAALFVLETVAACNPETIQYLIDHDIVQTLIYMAPGKVYRVRRDIAMVLANAIMFCSRAQRRFIAGRPVVQFFYGMLSAGVLSESVALPILQALQMILEEYRQYGLTDTLYLEYKSMYEEEGIVDLFQNVHFNNSDKVTDFAYKNILVEYFSDLLQDGEEESGDEADNDRRQMQSGHDFSSRSFGLEIPSSSSRSHHGQTLDDDNTIDINFHDESHEGSSTMKLSVGSASKGKKKFSF